LPEWKSKCIENMGFGLLNKISLYFETPFWNIDDDFIGLLNEKEENRGDFYLLWNLYKNCNNNPGKIIFKIEIIIQVL
jgi:hypothetical protein